MIEHSAKLLREDNALDLNYVVLDLPCTFFMLRSLRCARRSLKEPCRESCAPPHGAQAHKSAAVIVY